MEQPAERRREPRLPIVTEVYEQKTCNSLGHTADINAQGMMLVAKGQFNIGEEKRVSMDIPNGKKKPIRTSLTAQCRWCEPHLDTPFNNCGFKFIYPSPYDGEYIETLFMGLTKQY